MNSSSWNITDTSEISKKSPKVGERVIPRGAGYRILTAGIANGDSKSLGMTSSTGLRIDYNVAKRYHNGPAPLP